ncbi:hypothetical protein HU200_032470 [Digitaria exilis]|uniref:Uncharacterized protein n=1 Tax=Digitaria exilis TaxID=1010633 RepID=A0A835BJY8_9POAL|nr:hypothetical protein HU200_032470 [Digitaria exilis]
MIFRGECMTVECLFDGGHDEAKLWTMAGARALAVLVGTPSRELSPLHFGPNWQSARRGFLCFSFTLLVQIMLL